MADRPARILIVDDSRAVQIILRRVLQNIGYAGAEFKFADNVTAALAILAEETQDILITDFHMPEISGMELLEQVRGKLPDTMIGMITTETSPEILAHARSLGADFTLSKPFTEPMLVESLSVARENFVQRKTAMAKPESKPTLLVQPKEMLAKHLHAALKVGVRIEKIHGFDPNQWSMPWVVGFYSTGSETVVRGTCVVDRGGALIIGGALTDTSLPLASGAPVPETFTKYVKETLEHVRAGLFRAPPGHPVTLLKSQHAMNVNPRLKEMLISNKTTAAYRLQRIGWPEGHLAVMTH